MPSNFHTAIIAGKKFKDYRRSKDFFQGKSKNSSDKGIDALFGIENGKTVLASIYFDKKIWNSEQAKTWLKDNKQEYNDFEPALNEDESSASITTGNTGDVYAYKPKVLPTIARFGVVGPANTEGEPDSKKKKKYKMFIEHMEEYLEEAKGKKLEFYGKDYIRTLEREDLETTLFELADVLSNYDQSKAEVERIMYKQVDVENIRHYKDDDLVDAYMSLVKIAKKHDIKTECLK
jgi:hypothetical protein